MVSALKKYQDQEEIYRDYDTNLFKNISSVEEEINLFTSDIMNVEVPDYSMQQFSGVTNMLFDLKMINIDQVTGDDHMKYQRTLGDEKTIPFEYFEKQIK